MQFWDYNHRLSLKKTIVQRSFNAREYAIIDPIIKNFVYAIADESQLLIST